MMNSLSWMIYGAELTGSLSSFAWVTFGICVIVSVAGVIVWFANQPGKYIWACDDKDTVRASRVAVRSLIQKSVRPVLITAGVAALIGIVTPSSGTVYAIAASQMGEQVLRSKTGDKAFKALDAWLDRQIAGGQSR